MLTVGIIGAGAAGLLAAIYAAKGGAKTELIDRNERAGRKLFLTGKGRCNITSSADLDGFMKNIPHNGRFMFSAFGTFFSDDIIEILRSEGVPVKLERGGRYFPESDKSSDVIRALTAHAVKSGARLVFDTYVESVEKDETGFMLTMSGLHGGRRHYDRLIIATGGVS